MDKFKSFLVQVFDKLGFISADQKVSITNCAVFAFGGIVAFRTLFAGLTLNYGHINWAVQAIDVPSTLGFLYSLFNYGHKRQVINQSNSEQTDDPAGTQQGSPQ